MLGSHFQVASSSRPDDTDYRTYDMESIARRRVDDVKERKKIHEAAGMGLPCSPGSTIQQGLGTGRSKGYPSDSAGTVLKECSADNPPIQLDPHEQLTGMSSDQLIQFARAIGLEISSANFGLLEDVLSKIGGNTGRNDGDKGSGQYPSSSRGGSTAIESVGS